MTTLNKTTQDKIPKLRFNEFAEPWEEKRLGDILRERAVENNDNQLELYSLTIEHGVTPKTDRYKRDFLVKKLGEAYKVVCMNDFVYNPMNLRFGALAVHKDKYKVQVSKYYNIFHVINNNVTEFWENYLTTYNSLCFYDRMATGSLNEKKRVHFSEYLKFKFLSPSIPEQEKIAAFLSSVDKRVIQLTKKNELLEKYKKSVIQKIFNQDIRFKDNKGKDFPDWQEKKLREIATKVNDKNKTSSVRIVFTNSAVRGIINQQDYFNKDIANQDNLGGYYIVSKDDFVYNPRISRHAPVGPIKRNQLGTGVMSPLYSVFRFNEGNLEYLNLYFNTTGWHRYMKQIANFGARHDRMNITNGDFFKMPIPYPCPAEQQKIAEFLTALDDKIELAGRKLNKAQEFKKGLLQQMFV